jgi:archaetidylinositol phosphate synthase
VLSNLRDPFRPQLQAIAKLFAATRLPPGFWTALGLVFAFAAAFVYGWHGESALVIGGILLLVSGFFDLVDGEVARFTKRDSKRGAFLDSMADRIAEIAVFRGILVGGFAAPYLVFLAITLSLLVSYARARADSIGVRLEGIGVGERADRLLVVAVVGMLGFMEIAMIVVGVLAGITVVQRILVTARNAPAPVQVVRPSVWRKRSYWTTHKRSDEEPTAKKSLDR